MRIVTKDGTTAEGLFPANRPVIAPIVLFRFELRYRDGVGVIEIQRRIFLRSGFEPMQEIGGKPAASLCAVLHIVCSQGSRTVEVAERNQSSTHRGHAIGASLAEFRLQPFR